MTTKESGDELALVSFLGGVLIQQLISCRLVCSTERVLVGLRLGFDMDPGVIRITAEVDDMLSK